MPSWVWILIFLLLLVVILVTVMWLTGAFAGINGPMASPRGDDSRSGYDDGQNEPTALPPNQDSAMPQRSTPLRRSSRPPPALAGPAPDGMIIASDADPSVSRQRSGKPPPASAAGKAQQPQRAATPRRGVPPPAAAAWSKTDGESH